MGSERATRPLDEIAEVVDSLHQTPTYVETGIPMIRVKDIIGGRIDLAKTARVTEEVFQTFSQKRVPQPGDIIFSRVGSYGNFGYLTEGKSCCLGQNTALLVPKGDWRYLYYALISDGVAKQVEEAVVGAVQKTISLKNMKRLKIPFPGEPEQRRIAAVLGALDDKIEINRKMNQTLEAMAQALFKSWFVDFDPVIDNALRAGKPIPDELADKAERRRAVMAREDYAVPEYAGLFPDEFVESELGWIPGGWKVGDVDQLAFVGSGKRQKNRTKHPDNDSKYPLVGGAGQIAWTEDHLFDEPVIVTGRVGTLGVIQRWEEPIWPSDNALVIRPRNSDVYFFVYQQLGLVDFTKLNRGSTQPLLTQRDLKSLRFSIPSHLLLTIFQAFQSDIFGTIDGNNKESRTLATLRDTLLPKLISGEVRVPESMFEYEQTYKEQPHQATAKGAAS